MCRQDMFQVCVVSPHLPSSSAEPSLSPESGQQREDPLFLSVLALVSTLPHLPSCPLCLSPLLPNFVPEDSGGLEQAVMGQGAVSLQ